MKDNELKEKIRKNLKEDIAISNIRKELNIKSKKYIKAIYGILATCALFILCLCISKNINVLNVNDIGLAKNNDMIENNSIDNNISTDKIIFNDMSKINTKMADIDGRFEEKNIIQQFDFINNIDIPEYISLVRQGELYVKENSTDENYTKLRQYCLWYSAAGNENPPRIEIIFTKEETILDDCIEPDINNMPSSIINGKELKLFKSEYLPDNSKIAGVAFFKIDGYKISVEATKISESEFINIIKSIVNTDE